MMKDYEFAKSTGYTGSFEDYKRQRYDSYCRICHRCDTAIMGYQTWLQNQGE